MTVSRPVAKWLEQFRTDDLAAAVLAWYDGNGRKFPWRERPTLWSAWVSEIMLQQTRTEVVREYWPRFLRRFPDVQTLAAADVAEVLRCWEGLGYYRRARLLHAAAREIVAHWNGRLPSTAEEWMTLPGIGRYTAHAVLSIVEGQRLPVLEANTRRLYARLAGWPGDPAGPEGTRLLWEFAGAVLSSRRPGDFNQALMDLGSTICTPRDPGCDRCPLAGFCRARLCKSVHRIPPRNRRRPVIEVREAAVIILRRGRLLLRCNPEGEWWAGLWEFPRPKIAGERKPADGTSTRMIDREIRRMTGLVVSTRPTGIAVRATVTHHRICRELHAARQISGSVLKESGWVWQPLEALAKMPLSVPARKTVALLGGLASLNRQSPVTRQEGRPPGAARRKPATLQRNDRRRTGKSARKTRTGGIS